MATRIAQLSQLTLTSGGTRQALSSTLLIGYSVLITAESTNTGAVYIGDVAVTSTNGVRLTAGQSFLINCDALGGGEEKIDLRDIYWDGTTGDKIRVSYMVRY